MGRRVNRSKEISDQVLGLLRAGRTLTRSDIARELGVCTGQVSRTIDSLKFHLAETRSQHKIKTTLISGSEHLCLVKR